MGKRDIIGWGESERGWTWNMFAILTKQVYIAKQFGNLEVFINNKDLIELYRTGRSRKLKLPKQVVDKFFATVQKIEAAETIHDLLADKGLHFEKLKGSEDSFSMRLNQKYRLEMTVEWKNEAQTIGIFFLLTISNHYK